MFKLNHLHTFVTVAKAGNFTAAAGELELTSVGVSKHITQLEIELEQPLFDRSTRKIRLTSFGQEFLEQAQKILFESNTVYDWVENYNKVPTGMLRVVFQNINVLELMVLPWVEEFQVKYPKINLQFHVANTIIDFDKNHGDVYWAVGKYLGRDYPGIRSFPVLETKYGIFGSPDYFKKNGTPKTPDDLIHHKVISLTSNTPTNLLMINTGLNQIGGVPCVLMNESMSSSTNLADLAAQGLGLINGATEMSDIDSYLDTGQLIPVLEDYWIENAKLYVYYHTVKQEQSKVRAFIEFFMGKKEFWTTNK